MPPWLRPILLLAGLVCIGLALWSVIGDVRVTAAGGTPQPNFARLLLLSLAGGALLSTSRYRS
jgi:hypothetical protein